MRSGTRPVASAAFAVGMKAKCAELTALDVEQLRSQTEELLADGDPLRAAILAFATQYELCRFDAAQLVDLGNQLCRAVEIALLPEPPDLDRRDIHG
ncbi:MAG: hypothetical protein DI533_04590 [Cereibacter sphaeroides]|uniref:Uncharacterized protein n=1 Tax=Cereibacter sphaeroides TaxID=1063 RepID=A0A2W5SJR5_CERSP|nr:MAG: hypothetical protein DI533_04590 [Cereibacter sphaeroides]